MARTTAGGSIHVLGPLQVLRSGATVALRPAQRRLLAILLLDPAAELDRDTLQDRMWGDALPPTAASALQVHLSGIRRALPGLVATNGSHYELDLRRYEVDRLRFEELAARAIDDAAAGRWERVLRGTARAREAWRGAPYDELRDDEYAAAVVARLTAMHDEMGSQHVRALMALGQVDAAVVELRELVRRSPLREPFWEQLMLALHRAGRKAEALRTFEEARQVIADELGVEPGPGLRSIEEAIVRGDERLGESAPPSTPGWLPERRTSFVGREDDLESLAGLLEAHRLVTIVGGPGIGKTRLAIEVAHLLRNRYPGGAWFVGLSTARTTQDLVGAIGRILDLRIQAMPLDVLADRIRAREALIILDNCEHLASGCAALLQRVLERPGPIRIIATSRRVIGVSGEEPWSIGPLSIPSAPTPDAGAALRSPAVRLFVDRARAADRTYGITDASAPLVAALCRRTDGIPLALELAAAWTPALGPREIEEMLAGDEPPPDIRRGERIPEHHRSLQAAIEWSIALLAPEDQDLFHATSVFRGTFDLDNAAAICAPTTERRRIAAAIGRLVEASLLVADRREDGAVRYRMLVPIRELVRGRLEQREAWPELRGRFVSTLLGGLVSQSAEPFRAVTDLARIDDEIDNLREAFKFAIEDGRAEEVARVLVMLDGFFLDRYLSQEQLTWLDRVLPRVQDPVTRAHAFASAALAAQATNALDGALVRLEAALAAFRALGDETGTGRCLVALAGLHSNRGNWEAGLAAGREGLRLMTALGNTSGQGLASHYLATNLAYSGRLAESVEAFTEAAAHFRRSGELGRLSQTLSTAAYLAALDGDEGRAAIASGEAVAVARRSRTERRLVRALSAAATVQARWGDPHRSARMFADVHDRLRAQANEDLFELLLPAGLLVRREERWSLLVELVHAVEAKIGATGQGYPVPWRLVTEGWLRDARAAGEVRAEHVPDPPPAVAAVRAELRAFLADVAQRGQPGAASSDGARWTAATSSR